ncbi:MAG: rhodanese-like domain-containing protein [Bacteroidetes bacterium]|nr:rhodanese-like domain-containing protein [Bacteroidota bacterium]
MKSLRIVSAGWIALMALVLLSSCNKSAIPPASAVGESAQLVQWLNQNGNWINSDKVPAVISADDAYELLNGNNLFIDLRDASQYGAGHIPNAINIRPEELLDYLDKRLDINAFDKVVFVCSRGQLSAWVNGIVRLLGYDNTYSIRFGMNAWDATLANEGWDKAISDKWADQLVTGMPDFPKAVNDLPVVSTGKSSLYQIAHDRAAALLAESSASHFLEFDSLAKHMEEYFIINYWSPADYETVGHLPAARQFSPRKSLAIDAQLLSIPTTQKIVVYCYTGHHSAHAVAYLRMLGYDAYSLLYGANSFMHSRMQRDGWPASHQWSELQKRKYPLSSSAVLPVNPAGEIKKAAQGGC